MRSLGFADSRVTGAGADGGIDVIAQDAVAQVKHYSQPIGVGPVRELRGVADAHQHLLFYASGGYTAAARQFADERGVALYSLAELGHITPLNEAATRLSARPAPTSGWSQAAAWGRAASTARASQRAAELEAQRQTVLRLITRVRAHTSELHALPSNRYTKDLIKALKAAHKLIERADSLLAKSRADFQTTAGGSNSSPWPTRRPAKPPSSWGCVPDGPGTHLARRGILAPADVITRRCRAARPGRSCRWAGRGRSPSGRRGP
ncbi:hypothetical protein SSPO_026650 [Streptomyces antimycoticus]|uniref:Restriction endonuclease type IV Mrr domain-containing protein n=1 Tax=Streptomyces antimycoticus TaxID=68175 RepID=A0A499V180_9ACTN|nr:hypothetical protein SSPO_026650 [Streptomyces antimycoticus]